MGDGTYLNRAAILSLLEDDERYRSAVADYLLDHRTCPKPPAAPSVRTEAEVKAEALEEAATSLEGGLGVEGTPGTLYEYRAWLRARAAAIRIEARR